MKVIRIVATAVSIVIGGVILLVAANRLALSFREGATRITLDCYFDCLEKCAQAELLRAGRVPAGAPVVPEGPSCSDACKDLCEQD